MSTLHEQLSEMQKTLSELELYLLYFQALREEEEKDELLLKEFSEN